MRFLRALYSSGLLFPIDVENGSTRQRVKSAFPQPFFQSGRPAIGHHAPNAAIRTSDGRL